MSDTSSVPFRSASPAPEAPVADAPKPAGEQFRAGSKTDDVPPGLYQELEKKPYAVKFLDLDLYNDDPDFQEVRDQAKALDAYVIRQAKARGMKDSPESYKEIVEAIYKQIGKSTNEDPVKALKRLSIASSAIARLQSAKLQPVLSAENLTPGEYEGIQE